jgi:hypothetical protein
MRTHKKMDVLKSYKINYTKIIFKVFMQKLQCDLQQIFSGVESYSNSSVIILEVTIKFLI